MAIYAAFDVFPRAKGSTSHIASMIRALARNFGAVRVLCLGTPEMPQRQCEGAIEILRYIAPPGPLTGRLTAFASFVRKHAAGLSPELIAFRDPWGGYPLLEAHPRVPAIFEVNALPSWELEYTYPGFASSPALRTKVHDLERRCLSGAAAVLCVSSVTARALIAAGVDADRIAVIPNVAHDVFFAPPPEAPVLDPGRWFGYLGGLQPWQGVQAALDGFAIVAPDLPDLRFLILRGDNAAGLPALLRRVTRLGLGRRVHIAGPFDTPAVAAVLRRLEFSVVPLADTPRNTRQGCCPVKMVESMAAGTAVIASDLAVCREWIRHRKTGWLASPDDARSWATAIHAMATDGETRGRIAGAAALEARREFSWEAVHSRLDRVFQNVRGGRSVHE